MSLALVATAVNGQVSTSQLEKKQTLTKAQDTYYNVRRLGLIEFSAKVQPNWDLLLDGVEQKARAINLLSNLRFSASIDSQSKFQLTSRVDEPLTDPKTAEGLNRIVRGMDTTLKQFFATWSLFTLTSPFPSVGSEYEVIETAGNYRFVHKEGDSEVVTITDKDFMVIEIKVSAPTHNGWFKPALEKTPRGFILKSFESSFVSGQRVTSVKTRLEYIDVSGLQLLHKVSVDTVQNGAPAQMEWMFTDYQVKMR